MNQYSVDDISSIYDTLAVVKRARELGIKNGIGYMYNSKNYVFTKEPVEWDVLTDWVDYGKMEMELLRLQCRLLAGEQLTIDLSKSDRTHLLQMIEIALTPMPVNKPVKQYSSEIPLIVQMTIISVVISTLFHYYW